MMLTIDADDSDEDDTDDEADMQAGRQAGRETGKKTDKQTSDEKMTKTAMTLAPCMSPVGTLYVSFVTLALHVTPVTLATRRP